MKKNLERQDKKVRKNKTLKKAFIDKSQNQRTGRPSINRQYLIQRRTHAKQNYRALANYFNALQQSLFMTRKMIESSPNQKNNRDKGRLRDRIARFVGNKRNFLKMLSLLLRNYFPSIQQCLKTDYKKDFLTEPCPRTFRAGLIELRKINGLRANSSNILKKSIADIKCLFIASILIVGVGQIQIDQNIQQQSDQQIISCYFKQITSQLLDRTSLLNAKIFDKIQYYWQQAVKMMKNEDAELQSTQNHKGNKEQIKQNEKRQFQAIKASFNQIQTQLGPKQLKPEEIVKPIEEFDQLFVDVQRENSGIHGYAWDYDSFFNNLNEDFENEIEEKAVQNCQKQQKKVQIKNNKIQQVDENNQELCQKEGQIIYSIDKEKNIKQLQKESAIRQFNYDQANTRKNRNTNRKNNINRMAENYANQSLEWINGDLNSFKPESSTFNINDLLDQTSEQSFIRQQRELYIKTRINRPKLPNPNRQVPHQNRQIDQLVDYILYQQQIIGYCMANHIYNACKAQNIKIQYKQNLDDVKSVKKDSQSKKC